MLPTLLHPEFTRLLVHTGERFDRDEWVRFNADCPGFLTYEVRERVCAGDRVAAGPMSPAWSTVRCGISKSPSSSPPATG